MAFGDGGVDDFNPRSRKGSDEVDLPVELGGGISIHAPARGATRLLCLCIGFHLNFNPRSRKGSDLFRASVLCRQAISIHAPARGATVLSCPFDSVHDISIHAPARGATERKGGENSACYYFNPRSRKGSDLFLY